jgi:hypothetical protein
MTDCRAALQELVRLYELPAAHNYIEERQRLWNAAWDAARAALVLPVPEPVAWMLRGKQTGYREYFDHEPEMHEPQFDVIPLYALPGDIERDRIPREPTPEMMKAGIDESDHQYGRIPLGSHVRKIYQAMYDAALAKP